MVGKELALQAQGLVFLTWWWWQVVGVEAAMVVHTYNPGESGGGSGLIWPAGLVYLVNSRLMRDLVSKNTVDSALGMAVKAVL